MSLTVVLFVMFIILPLIVGAIIVHKKRNWMIEHIFCPPEIMFIETPEERSKVCKQAFFILLRRPVTWVLVLVYAVITAFLIEELKYTTVFWFKVLPGNEEIRRFAWILFMFIPYFFPYVLLSWHERRWMRKYLRTYLNEHGTPICMKCGYDLRGLTEQRCPECGKSFE